MSPAELMAMTGQMTQMVRDMSAAMKAAVQELVTDGWTETQAKELVHAMLVSGLRGQTPNPEGAPT